MMMCGGTCVDTNTDNNNCGACGNGCTDGTCMDGICCPTGQLNCGGTCIDVSNDPDNCGECEKACSDTQTCQNGTCCGDGTMLCGTQCFDLQTDPMHCGDCQTMCDAGTETCSDGKCCPNGQINCNGTCIDPMTDLGNCGACAGDGGDVCDPGTEKCDSGICCGQNESACGSSCFDLQNDPAHCGSCTNACGATEACIDGMCCTPGNNVCGGVCSDPMTDENNCGGCAGAGGMACGDGETCTDGLCCGPGEVACNGQCVDTLVDADNCGTCENQCTGGTPVCSGGTCAATCKPGETSCSGDCVDLDSDHNNCGSCGNECAANQVCSDGVCSSMCTGDQVVCDGSCVNTDTDRNHCGDCTTVCAPGDECVAGKCQLDCPAGEELCNGECRNFLTDPKNCGMCGVDCGTGTCQTGMCCPAGFTRCGNECVDLQNNPDHCGTCITQCGGSDVCTAGVCCASDENNCGGTCSDPATDDQNCGMCGNDCTETGDLCSNGMCCPPGEENMDGICCPTGWINCGGQCVNPKTNVDFCGNCQTSCSLGEVCSDGMCQVSCDPPNEMDCGICTDIDTDPTLCGTSCQVCATGATCSGGVCQPCPQGPADGCNGVCTNTDTDPKNCGACGISCGIGEVCTDGICCAPGEIACGGTCVDPTSDEANCGGCAGAGGQVCSAGSVCTNGDCACPFGQIECNGMCLTPSVDPLNCGECGNKCGVGQNIGMPFCVSNGCTDTCPAPLSACGTGPNAKCTNLDTDNDNCGQCGKSCPNGQGCSDGVCVPLFPLLPDPDKCVGGGPPIVIPTGGGEQECSGNIGATAFTFGLCSRTNIGPLSQLLYTDAFNSLEGPYKPSCSTDADCGKTGRCIGGTCAGGGVGVNGNVSAGTPLATNTANTHVGGDFWVFGQQGLEIKTDTTVKQRFFNEGPLKYAKTNRVYGDAFVNGPFSTQGQGSLQIDGTLTAASCSGLPNSLSSAGCTAAPWDTNLKPPCGEPDGSDGSLIPVRAIVEHFRNPANNDNDEIGLDYNATANVGTRTRIELPCGYYYLNSIGGNAPLTIVVKGRTALFVGGAANINVEMIFDVQPNASLDMFIGGVVRIAHPITLGSPAYPRLTRMYIGSSSTAGGGAACDEVSDCGGGVCSACPNDPFEPCSGMGICGPGPGLSNAIEMSQGGYFNGLLWAGYGSFQTSNQVEMYGSVFANYADASGALRIHYDNAAVLTGGECPPPPASSSCESCRDCNNQACVNNQCSACTLDSQCCPPLRCDNGTCRL